MHVLLVHAIVIHVAIVDIIHHVTSVHIVVTSNHFSKEIY